MADFVFNVALGRFAEFANRVDQNDPANAVFIVAAFNSTAADATIKDVDTLAAVEAVTGVAEITDASYARIVLDDSDVAAISPDDANDRMDIDLSDFVWASVTGTAWTDLLVGYDSNSTAGTDANIIPCLWEDFPITPDGSNVTAELNSAGIFRAS